MSAATAYDVSGEIDRFCQTRAKNLQKASGANNNIESRRLSYDDRQGNGSIRTTSTTTSSPGESTRTGGQRTSKCKLAQ